jgi:hypothetical protein
VPFKIVKVFTDNGKALTDRLEATGQREPTGNHPFDTVCADNAIDHRLIKPRATRHHGQVRAPVVADEVVGDGCQLFVCQVVAHWRVVEASGGRIEGEGKTPNSKVQARVRHLAPELCAAKARRATPGSGGPTYTVLERRKAR